VHPTRRPGTFTRGKGHELAGRTQDALERDPRLTANGELLKNQITELALKADRELLRLLLSHDRLKAHFFADVDGVLVFDRDKFLRLGNNKAFLPDSYTAFKNRCLALLGETGYNGVRM